MQRMVKYSLIDIFVITNTEIAPWYITNIIIQIGPGKGFRKVQTCWEHSSGGPRFFKEPVMILITNSAGADGGPTSRVCARMTLRSAPH